MSLDPFEAGSRIVGTAGKMIKDSALTVWDTTKSEPDMFSKPGVALAEIGKESVLLPVRGIAKISSWAIRKMGTVLLGTVKLGAQTAMMIPLPVPLPAGCNSLAEATWKIGVMKDAFAEKARGNPRAFGAIFDTLSGTISNVRNDASNQAIGEYRTAA